jgi:hypothetical protein
MPAAVIASFAETRARALEERKVRTFANPD